MSADGLKGLSFGPATLCKSGHKGLALTRRIENQRYANAKPVCSGTRTELVRLDYQVRLQQNRKILLHVLLLFLLFFLQVLMGFY